MKDLLVISFLFIGLAATAQIKVNKPIELNNTDPTERQVNGLPDTILPEAVITAGMELENPHRVAQPTAGSQWQIDLLSIDQAPQTGTQLLVHSPTPTSGPLQVMVNEHGPYGITKGATEVVDGSSIPEGTMLSLVFDGSSFQLINGTGRILRECPEGMVTVNEQFCIQTESSPATMEFWDAIESCGAQGLRLCSWGEFHAACTNAAVLGISSIGSAWEWTNQTTNEDGTVRVVGSSSCQSASTSTPINPRKFRCCLSR